MGWVGGAGAGDDMFIDEGGDIGVEGREGGVDGVHVLVEAEVGGEKGVQVGMGTAFEGGRRSDGGVRGCR